MIKSLNNINRNGPETKRKVSFNKIPCLMLINYLSDQSSDKNISDLSLQLYFQLTPKITSHEVLL